jgi:hypothetical protein
VRIGADVWANAGLRIKQIVGVARIEFPIHQAVRPVVTLAAREHRVDLGAAEIVGDAIVVIAGVEGPGEAELAQIILAENLPALAARARDGRQ